MTPAKHAYIESALPEEERNRALMEHLPQVRYIARHIHDRLPQHVSVEDLVHAGILGLIDALQKYDGTKNVQFKTYAKFRIRGAILDSLPIGRGSKPPRKRTGPLGQRTGTCR